MRRAPLLLLLFAATCTPRNRAHLGPMAWSSQQWRSYCGGVRTSYNPGRDLSDEALTLVPGDPRWLDFVYWAINNKIAEHQVEAYGGTGWKGPKGGVIFHWAPGSHWERDTLMSFGFSIGHTVGEHSWRDTMFPDFFERYGGVTGVNVKDRLAEIDPHSSAPWVAFLEYGGGNTSPYYRYLFHKEAHIDSAAQRIDFLAGQGVAFSYSFRRYYHELREVLTDCRAVDLFRMYDQFGPGFASEGNWAHQVKDDEALFGRIAMIGDKGPRPGVGGPRYNPSPPTVPVPAGVPEAEAMQRGQTVYLRQCGVCHGITGDGAGFLAEGFSVKPRDFRSGVYKYRTTEAGQLPTMADLERSIGDGIPGTTMPTWRQFLTEQEIHDVARYLIAFSPRFTAEWKAQQRPKLLALPPAPANLAALADQGAAVAKRMQCAQCHGPAGKGDGPSAPSLRDQWDHPAPPTDLTYKWVFRNGHRPEDLYRTLFGGLDGAPMPSYAAAVPDRIDRWALISYVLSLSPATQPRLHLADYPKGRARINAEGFIDPVGEQRP